MKLVQGTIVLTGVGADGSATDTQTCQTAMQGKIVAVRIVHSAGQAATTDTTLKFGDFTILSVANSATTAQFAPRVLLDGEDGVALTAVYDYFYVDGNLTATIAQGDSAETTTLTILCLED